MTLKPMFDQSEIRAIAKSLGDTTDGLTGGDISYLLQCSKIPDLDSTATKWIRLFNAFCSKQNTAQNRTNILEFIRQAMKPSRFIGNQERFETLRSNLNAALSFSGLEISQSGELSTCSKVSTLTEAENRASQLKLSLKERDIHQDVIKFCRAELLQNNYFHAVLEAVKSVIDKLRRISNFTDDGHELINKCFSGESPIIKINSLNTKSEKVEQSGLSELIKGVYSMFRNTISHEAKINWEVTQKDAEDLLTIVSMIHRRIDARR
jgi:uncharacterized protein (TIGR02391 family)